MAGQRLAADSGDLLLADGSGDYLVAQGYEALQLGTVVARVAVRAPTLVASAHTRTAGLATARLVVQPLSAAVGGLQRAVGVPAVKVDVRGLTVVQGARAAVVAPVVGVLEARDLLASPAPAFVNLGVAALRPRARAVGLAAVPSVGRPTLGVPVVAAEAQPLATAASGWSLAGEAIRVRVVPAGLTTTAGAPPARLTSPVTVRVAVVGLGYHGTIAGAPGAVLAAVVAVGLRASASSVQSGTLGVAAVRARLAELIVAARGLPTGVLAVTFDGDGQLLVTFDRLALPVTLGGDGTLVATFRREGS